MRRIVSYGLLIALGALVTIRPTTGQDEEEFHKKRAKAIEKGVDWLKKQQQSDGSWDYEDKPFNLSIHMKEGSTALAAYALLKAGVLPADPCIQKGVDYVTSKPPTQIYAAGCALLMLEARANWEPPPEPEDEGEETGTATKSRREKKPEPKKLKPSSRDMDYAARCVDLIVKTQQARGAWRYLPASGPAVEKEDSSNPQYALLGLDAAERMGLPVPKDVYEKATNWFVTYQEADGPEVPGFPVPGADMTYVQLKKIEKEMKDKIRKIDSEFKGKKEGDVNKAGHTEEDERRTVQREAADKVFKTGEKLRPMKARGWAYAYEPKDDSGGSTQGGGGRQGGGALPEWKKTVTGSMTTSALACLFICKAHLDGTKLFDKSLRGPVDKALRDGCAWIANNYSVKENPKGQLHHYYYMYGLERAGIIGVVPKFGEHDWYNDGTKMFMDEQHDDGSWNAGMAKGTSGPIPDTSFALLFLSRGTTPVVRIPTRTATGGAQRVPGK